MTSPLSQGSPETTNDIRRTTPDDERRRTFVEVDVIVPVHNASKTLRPAIESVFSQVTIPEPALVMTTTSIHVCCFDDGSTDDSWEILKAMKKEHEAHQSLSEESSLKPTSVIEYHLCIAKSPDGVSRGAGYARNQAVAMRRKNNQESADDADNNSKHRFLCLLDSDDLMHPTRIMEQVRCMLSLPNEERERTLLGCNFVRDPPGSTWHYTDWANNLTQERLSLERFREVTLLQPTWMMCKSRFEMLGGYIEAPHPADNNSDINNTTVLLLDDYLQRDAAAHPNVLRLVHRESETAQTLRVAEDLRFLHAHLAANGLLRKCCSSIPLVTYRHGLVSQSSNTPRKLLLQLRARAFETCILEKDWKQQNLFVVWGAGRDGKDFVKALSPKARRRVYCFVDVDERKIMDAGYYVNRELDVKIPIVHFSLLTRDTEKRDRLERAWQEGLDHECSAEVQFGRIDKSKKSSSSSIREANKKDGDSVDEPGNDIMPPASKRRKLHNVSAKDLDLNLLPTLPVVVCVAMYRTNGALETNVKNIGRTEGKDLWHFS